MIAPARRIVYSWWSLTDDDELIEIAASPIPNAPTIPNWAGSK